MRHIAMWAVQGKHYTGNVNLKSRRGRSFYSYSLWATETGEHLFDGAAGDLTEALDSLRAHIRYLSSSEKRLTLVAGVRKSMKALRPAATHDLLRRPKVDHAIHP